MNPPFPCLPLRPSSSRQWDIFVKTAGQVRTGAPTGRGGAREQMSLSDPTVGASTTAVGRTG